MLLLIDNYDSFTYNLFHFLGELGAQVVVRRNDALTAPEALPLVRTPSSFHLDLVHRMTRASVSTSSKRQQARFRSLGFALAIRRSDRLMEAVS